MVVRSICRLLKTNRIGYSSKTFNSVNFSLTKCYSSQTSLQKERWDLISAVSVERKPVIARQLNEIESKTQNLLNKLEFEKSSLSNHEIQLITDKIKLEKLKKGEKLDLDTIPEQSAQDFEDASLAELKRTTFASAITDEDKNNDTKSINRQLDRNLLLIIKEKVGNNSVWILPQGIRQEGETLRQTAERVLKEKCGPDLKADFFGNAPVGFYKYKYPQKFREKKSDSAVGAKIFFYKAQLIGGSVTIDSKQLSDYQWATRKELNIMPNEYFKSVAMFLIDEEH